MFDLPSLRLGRLFGIPLEVNLSWLIIFGLLSFSLAFGVFPGAVDGLSVAAYLGLAAVTALMFFVSIVLHELAHSLVARAGGVHVDRITLFMLGGVSQMDEEPHTAGREFVMAFAGPAMSFVLGIASFVLAAIAQFAGAPAYVVFPLSYLGSVNILVGIFNLLPGFPLDGGRVLRAILWGITHDLNRATLWAARTGQFIGWSMVALTVAGVAVGGAEAVPLIWFGLIGWFIASLAGQAYRQQIVKQQLSHVRVGSVMTPHPQTAPGDITLEQLAHDYFLGGRHSRYPVMFDGHVIGLITLPDVKAVPRERWPFVRVAEVTERDLQRMTVDSSASLDVTVDRLGSDRPGALLVVEAGRLIGIVTRADVIAASRRVPV
ncbi:MAG: site-2 protease family protein [Coriobacteriales bacterium]|nr:site-2 protease family protein [Coriobacteriales bacterium]